MVLKFDKGQMFKTVKINSDIDNYPIAFVYDNGDTLRSSLFWYAGKWTDVNKNTFIHFYLPPKFQESIRNESNKDSIEMALYYELDSILQNYLNKKFSN